MLIYAVFTVSQPICGRPARLDGVHIPSGRADSRPVYRPYLSVPVNQAQIGGRGRRAGLSRPRAWDHRYGRERQGRSPVRLGPATWSSERAPDLTRRQRHFGKNTVEVYLIKGEFVTIPVWYIFLGIVSEKRGVCGVKMSGFSQCQSESLPR